MNNANDQFRHHVSSANLYNYLCGTAITDGAKAMADSFQCHWFLQVIASYQPELTMEEFQVWRLKKFEDESALVTCDNGNGHILRRQMIPYTDFKADEGTLWCVNNIILLPSEY